MKLKGLTKLALSGVALAAVAATLGTSTYAWYVTNAKATVDGVQGASKAIGAGSIYVAQNLATPTAETQEAYDAAHGHTDFKPELTLETYNLIAPEAENVTGLNPVTPRTGAWAEATGVTSENVTNYYIKDAEGKYKKATAYKTGEKYYTQPAAITNTTAITNAIKWYDVDGKEASTNHYIQFDIWLYSSDTATVKLNYTFENTTLATAYVPQVAYASNGSPVAMGSSFVKNIQDALRMGYTRTEYENTGATTVTTTAVAKDGEGKYTGYDGNVAYFTVAATGDASKVTGKTYYTLKSANTYEQFDGTTFASGTTYYEFTRQYFDDENQFKDYDGSLVTRETEKATQWTAKAPESKILDVKSGATKSTAPNADFDFATGGNANTYYNSVLGKDPVFATEFAGVTGVQQFTLTAKCETKLSFYVWLEGTDVDCFDSVAGQSFEFEFAFTA